MQNLLYLFLTWTFLFATDVHAQKRSSLPPCAEDCKIIKKCECDIFNQKYRDNRELYIHFNKNGQLIGDIPSILRKGDKLFFAIEGQDFTNSPLQKKIKEYKDKLGKIKYKNLSIESQLLFPDSTAFEEYKKSISSYLPQIDKIDINSIYTLSVQWQEKKNCPKTDTLTFDITKAPCDSVAISKVFEVPCDLDEAQVGFTLTRQNIDNILMANYLKENKDCYGQWGQYAPNFNKVKNDFIKKAKVIDDSLHAFDYSVLMGTVKDSLPSENLQKLLKDNNNLTTVNTYLEKALLNVPENKEWMKKWLWLTGLNTPAMNPFDKIKIDNNSILNVDKELAATQRRIDAIGLVIKNSQLSDNNDKIIKKYLNELDTLQQKVVELTDKKKDLTNRKEAYEKWLIEREISSNLLYAGTLFVSEAEQINWMPHYNALNNYRLSNAPNSIPSVVADIDAVRPLVFNLRRGTKAFAEETVTPFTLTTPISDAFNAWGKLFDGILAQANNVGSSVAVTNVILANLSNKEKIVNDELEAKRKSLDNVKISFETTKMLATFTDNSGTTVPQQTFRMSEIESPNFQQKKPNKKITEDAEKIKKASINNSKEQINAIKTLGEITKTSLIESIESYQLLKQDTIKLYKERAEIKQKKKLLEVFLQSRQRFSFATAQLKWLNAQTNPPLQINVKPNTDTLYHTDWAEAREIKEKKGAVKIGYDLSVSDGKTATKVVKNASYKQYDLPRFWYGVGLAYIPKPRYTSVYENGAFVNNPEPQQLDIVVGAKIYPFKPMNQLRTCKLAKYTHYGRCYDRLRGNGHINRLSVFVGLGVRYKFLRNYFIGLGYDIIPGININAGYNFYFKRSYEIENGKLLNSYERLASGGVYYSITTDVEVFKRLVQLINPF